MKLRHLFVTVWACAAIQSASATNYYLDAANGDDSRAGTAPETAWRSLAKVNATTFQPGDSLLLKSGAAWHGVLHPLGSGQARKLIRIGSYGGDARPIIHGDGVEAAVFLHNQSYWEIGGLEVTNTGTIRGEYVGIMARNSTGAATEYIRVHDCHVHGVNGITAAYYGKNAGIAVVADMNGSFWNDVRIERNLVEHVDRMGIFVGPTVQLNAPNEWMSLPRSNDIVIRNNTISDSGGDAILNFVTRRTLIEHNVVADCGGRASDGSPNPTSYTNKYSAGIWSAIATQTVIQFNEVYGERTTFDGEGYDIDLGSDDIVVQYNYSHHNLGGFLLYCESGSRADIVNAKVRFNISHDDGRGIFVFCQNGLSPSTVPFEITNNTVYLPRDAHVPLFTFIKGAKLKGPMNVRNNIFVALGTTDYCAFDGAVFDHNLYFGDHPATEPADAHKLTADPLFVAAGSATIGRANGANGYRLRAGSPALGRGVALGATSMGAIDYWGNVVSPDTAPNLGAYNGPGITGAPENFALNAAVTALTSSEHGTWSKARVVDGQNLSTLGTSGYSSQLGLTTEHTEWIALDFGAPRTFSHVTLYPRTTPGFVGEGFPRSFALQTWNDDGWKDLLVVSDQENPGAAPREYRLPAPATTAHLRLFCTKLDQIGRDFVLQLAEIRVEP